MYILYLEDEPADAALIERYFQTTPHAIRVVQTIADAEKALSTNPLLILVDVMLGTSRDGLVFIRMAREKGYRHPILAITGLALPQDIDNCLSAGCTEIIQKPFAISDLDRVFSKYIALP